MPRESVQAIDIKRLYPGSRGGRHGTGAASIPFSPRGCRTVAPPSLRSARSPADGSLLNETSPALNETFNSRDSHLILDKDGRLWFMGALTN